MQVLTKLLKGFILCVIIIRCAVFSASGQSNQQQNIINSHAKPIVFAPGVISTQADEFAPSFTPDGKTVYFSGDSGKICFSKLVNGKWSKPRDATFTGQWKNMDPFISPDGKRLFYSSYRPLDGLPQSQPQKYAHIWYVDYVSDDNWSVPHHLEAPINLEGINNYAPSVSSLGTLCFFSPGRDSRYRRKSFSAKWLGNHYDEPKPLQLNDTEVKDPFVAPDESYLLFTSGNDIYISFRNDNGWASGQKLGPQINNGSTNAASYVSPDGKILYYSASNIKGIVMIPVNLTGSAH
jgi:Tol biopolymer transport system component